MKEHEQPFWDRLFKHKSEDRRAQYAKLGSDRYMLGRKEREEAMNKKDKKDKKD